MSTNQWYMGVEDNHEDETIASQEAVTHAWDGQGGAPVADWANTNTNILISGMGIVKEDTPSVTSSVMPSRCTQCLATLFPDDSTRFATFPDKSLLPDFLINIVGMDGTFIT